MQSDTSGTRGAPPHGKWYGGIPKRAGKRGLVVSDTSPVLMREAPVVAPDVDLRAIFDASPSPCLVLSPDLIIVEVNEAYLHATMTVRKEILGRSLFEVFPDNPDDPNADGVAHARVSLAKVSREHGTDVMPTQRYDVRDPDGVFVERYWSPRNTAVCRRNGQLAYIIHNIEDVTEYVQATNSGKEQAQTSRELQDRYDQAKLQSQARERQLLAHIAEDRARLSDEVALKDAFLGVLSHELKTPITTIIGNAEILRRHGAKLSDDARDAALDDIVVEGNRFTRILDNLLLLARTETGANVEREPCEIVRVAERVVADRRRHGGRAITIEAADDTPLVADCAESYLEQVLVNLLSNATKYSPPEGVIVVRVDAVVGHVRVRVLDSGPGFTPEQAEHVFDSFYRIRDQRSVRAGLGIGLAVCKRLITVMGGTIWALSRPEGGAEVGFSLPQSSAD